MTLVYLKPLITQPIFHNKKDQWTRANETNEWLRSNLYDLMNLPQRARTLQSTRTFFEMKYTGFPIVKVN